MNHPNVSSNDASFRLGGDEQGANPAAASSSLAKVRRDAAKREEELKAETTSILESIHEGFLTVDADFRFTYVNAGAERSFGIPRAELLGMTIWESPLGVGGTHYEVDLRRRIVVSTGVVAD